MKFNNVLFMLVAVLILTSCEKKDDNSLPKNSHRLIRTYTENMGYFYIDSLFYDGEKLISIMNYYKEGNEEWTLTDKTEITYNGSHVTMLESSLETQDWIPQEKYEFTLDDGLMTEEIASEFYDGSWVLEWKWTYQYSGNNLKSWQSYEPDEDGGFYLDNKCEYTYQNGKLSESIESILNGETWDQYSKTTYLYDEGKLVNWTEERMGESDSWDSYFKSDLTYTGELVSQIDHYGWEGSDWQPSKSFEFTYNSNEYLYEISIETAFSGATSYTAYEYEEGNGNALLFYYYPEEMVSGQPMLKSANTKSKRSYIPYYKRILSLQ